MLDQDLLHARLVISLLVRHPSSRSTSDDPIPRRYNVLCVSVDDADEVANPILLRAATVLLVRGDLELVVHLLTESNDFALPNVLCVHFVCGSSMLMDLVFGEQISNLHNEPLDDGAVLLQLFKTQMRDSRWWRIVRN